MSLSTQQTIDVIDHWFSAPVVGFDITSQIISKLVKGGRVTNISSMYRLNVNSFRNLSKIRPVQAEAIIARIAANNKIPLANAILGLGIPGVDEVVAIKLSSEYKTFDNFIKCAFKPFDFKVFSMLDAEEQLKIENWFNRIGSNIIEPLQTISGNFITILEDGVEKPEAVIYKPVQEVVVEAPTTVVEKLPVKKPQAQIPKLNQKPSFAVSGKKFYLKGRFKGLKQSDIINRIKEKKGVMVETMDEADTLILGSKHGIYLPVKPDGVVRIIMEELPDNNSDAIPSDVFFKKIGVLV